MIEKVKDLLVFESEDDFYFLQILQRKLEIYDQEEINIDIHKDNPINLYF